MPFRPRRHEKGDHLERIRSQGLLARQLAPDGRAPLHMGPGVGGGVGSTSLSVNVAAALAEDPGNSPVIIDLDLTLGDADVWLDIIPDYTIRDVSENISRLDYGLLKRSLTRHDCGVYLLPRPVEVETQELVRSDDLRRILALLKATFSHQIIDLSKGFGPLDMSAMEVSDKILLVTPFAMIFM